MCLGIPGRITAITDPARLMAMAEVSGVRREVNVACVAGADLAGLVGQWVLIHVGFAMSLIDEDEAEKTISAALDMGITLFDTADAYGAGRMEQMLGKLVPKSDELTVVTKLGIDRNTEPPRRRFEAGQRRQVIRAALGVPNVIGAGRERTVRPTVNDFEAQRMMDTEMRVQAMGRRPGAKAHPSNVFAGKSRLAQRELAAVDDDLITLGDEARNPQLDPLHG